MNGVGRGAAASAAPPVATVPVSADAPAVPATGSIRPRTWPRLLLVEALTVPALALVLFAPGAAACWIAGLWGSVVCCAGTDSGWRWRNRLLVAQAVAWLLVALVLGTVR